MTEATRRRRIADYHSRFAPELIDRELERRIGNSQPEEHVERLEALRSCVSDLGENGREILKLAL